MVSTLFLVFFSSFAGFGNGRTFIQEDPEKDWGYNCEEHLGPPEWKQSFPNCGGQSQSGLNIESSCTQHLIYARELDFNDNHCKPPKCWTITNVGKTVTLEPSSWEKAAPILSGGPMYCETYNFRSIHFHFGCTGTCGGSENTVDEESFAMEFHLGYWNSKYEDMEAAMQHPDGLTTIVIPVRVDEPCAENEGLKIIADWMIHVRQKGDVWQTGPNPLAIKMLLPVQTNEYFTYSGSQSMPPCTEVVTMIIMRETIAISAESLEKFRKLENGCGKMCGNIRPPQKLNGRVITEVP